MTLSPTTNFHAPEPQRNPLSPADHVGPFLIERLHARGGMGIVYRATDTNTNRTVALKTLGLEALYDHTRHRRFRREAQAGAAVSHTNVIPVYHYETYAGIPVLVMPFIRGRSLAAVLRATSLPVATACGLGAELADALGAIHGAGIVHRDIKPGNVLVAADARPLVIDFSAACAAGTGGPAWEPLTEPGAMIGTPAYMSPEQVEGARADPRSDIFSLGVVLYQMLTGVSPFAGASAYATIAALTRCEVPPPRRVNGAVPEALSALVSRMLSKDPRDRPQTAPQVAHVLRTAPSG